MGSMYKLPATYKECNHCWASFLLCSLCPGSQSVLLVPLGTWHVGAGKRPALWRALWEHMDCRILKAPPPSLPPGPFATLRSESWQLGPAGPCPHARLSGKDSGSIVEVWGLQDTELMSSGYLWHFSPRTFWCPAHWSHRAVGPETGGPGKAPLPMQTAGEGWTVWIRLSDQVCHKGRNIYGCLKWDLQLSQLQLACLTYTDSRGSQSWHLKSHFLVITKI